MTYRELERTLGPEVVRSMETSLAQAFSSAGRIDKPETYDALLELLTALLAASLVTREREAANRARQLATRLVALVDTSLLIKEAYGDERPV